MYDGHAAVQSMSEDGIWMLMLKSDSSYQVGFLPQRSVPDSYHSQAFGILRAQQNDSLTCFFCGVLKIPLLSQDTGTMIFRIPFRNNLTVSFGSSESLSLEKRNKGVNNSPTLQKICTRQWNTKVPQKFQSSFISFLFPYIYII